MLLKCIWPKKKDSPQNESLSQAQCIPLMRTSVILLYYLNIVFFFFIISFSTNQQTFKLLMHMNWFHSLEFPHDYHRLFIESPIDVQMSSKLFQFICMPACNSIQQVHDWSTLTVTWLRVAYEITSPSNSNEYKKEAIINWTAVAKLWKDLTIAISVCFCQWKYPQDEWLNFNNCFVLFLKPL